MSVTFLTNAHVDVLINGLRQFGRPAPDTPLQEYQRIGQALWDDAIDRYNSRYAAAVRCSYVLHTTSEKLDPPSGAQRYRVLRGHRADTARLPRVIA